MSPRRRNFIHIAAGMLALLLVCPSAQATTIILTGNYDWSYRGITVGPYQASLNGSSNLLVYCMDLHIDTRVNTPYNGGLSTPDTQAEEEAAFLAAYSLYLGAASSNPQIVNTVEGPIAMAIWQLMGTLGSTALDPAAQPYVLLAQSAFSQGLITPAFLKKVSIWEPAVSSSSQRFVTAVRDDDMFKSAVPEPGTAIYLGSGVLLAGIGALVFRRKGETQ
jgi:hypothetical protein